MSNVYLPTVLHEPAEGHDTELSEFAFGPLLALPTSDHVDPFHDSTSV